MSLQIPVVPFKTTDHISYFVRTDGSDNNDGSGNTAATAFQTIKKALSMVPQVVNHVVQIFVAPGTYAERILINGFSGAGEIRINPGQSAVSTTYNFQNVRVYNCSIPVSISGIYASTTTMNSFEAYNSVDVELMYCYASGGTSTYHGVYAYGSNVYMYTCAVNLKGYAVYAGQNSNVLVWSCNGSGNDIGLYAGEGGKISTAGTVMPAGAVATSSANGGLINPWGDNTLAYRSAMRASIGTGQSCGANMFTKLQFNTLHQDYQVEYSITSYRFTAKKAGWYLVSGGVNVNTAPTGTALTLSVFVNGAREVDIGSYSATGTPLQIAVQGATALLLPAFSYVELFLYPTTNAVTTYSGPIQTHFTVTQIA